MDGKRAFGATKVLDVLAAMASFAPPPMERRLENGESSIRNMSIL